MSVTAGNLYAAARARVGLNFADGRLDDENITGVLVLINAGLNDLSVSRDWEFLYAEGTISVVAGTESYATPTNHLRTLWIADDTDEELHLRQRRDHIRFGGEQGDPAYYAIFNDLIYLSPIPNATATYRHGYYTYIPAVTDNSIANLQNTTLAIPLPFQNLAALFIAKQIALAFRDYNLYNAIKGEIADEQRRVDDNNRRSLGPVAPQTRKDY